MIENHMVIGDYYPNSDPETIECDICQAEFPEDEQGDSIIWFNDQHRFVCQDCLEEENA